MTTTLTRIGFHRGQPLEAGQRVTYMGDAGTITEAGNHAMSVAPLADDEHTAYDMLVTVTLDDPTRKPVVVGTANVVVIS